MTTTARITTPAVRRYLTAYITAYDTALAAHGDPHLAALTASNHGIRTVDPAHRPQLRARLEATGIAERRRLNETYYGRGNTATPLYGYVLTALGRSIGETLR